MLTFPTTASRPTAPLSAGREPRLHGAPPSPPAAETQASFSLDRSPEDLPEKPFLAETMALLHSVRDHDFDALGALCSDGFGIDDGDPVGAISVARSEAEWEQWFDVVASTSDAGGSSRDSQTGRYEAFSHTSMGFSSLEFRLFVAMGRRVRTVDCVATVVWRWAADGSREATWHVSVVAVDADATT